MIFWFAGASTQAVSTGAYRAVEFIKAIAGFATAWPVTVHAQQPERVRRIGVILASAADDAEFQAWFGAAAIAAAVICSGGCTSLHQYVHNGFKVGPNYAPPSAPVADDWIDVADERVRSETDDLTHWWTAFSDPVLEDLIRDAYRQNLPLREAGFRDKEDGQHGGR